MMATRYVLRVRIRWWFVNIYLPMLIGFVHFVRVFVPDAEPDERRLSWWLDRAIVVETVGADA